MLFLEQRLAKIRDDYVYECLAKASEKISNEQESSDLSTLLLKSTNDDGTPAFTKQEMGCQETFKKIPLPFL